MIEVEDLLIKINSGKSLRKSEVEEVAALLDWIREDSEVAEKISVDDVYSMLLVIGRAKDRKHQHLLARYLDVKDALTVAFVLEILCIDWNCRDEFMERVINFALGASWDQDEDVRHTAFKILGEYLFESIRKNGAEQLELEGAKVEQRRKVLELLLSALGDTELEPWTRQHAYFALCRAGGKSWEEIPSEYSTLDLSESSKDIDSAMIQRLRDVAGSSPSSSSSLSSTGASPATR